MHPVRNGYVAKATLRRKSACTHAEVDKPNAAWACCVADNVIAGVRGGRKRWQRWGRMSCVGRGCLRKNCKPRLTRCRADC